MTEGWLVLFRSQLGASKLATSIDKAGASDSAIELVCLCILFCQEADTVQKTGWAKGNKHRHAFWHVFVAVSQVITRIPSSQEIKFRRENLHALVPRHSKPTDGASNMIIMT